MCFLIPAAALCASAAVNTTISIPQVTSGTPVYGAPLTFSSTVYPEAAGGPAVGTVTFIVDGIQSTPQPVDNSVSTITLRLGAGIHSFTAHYDGDSQYAPSTSGTLGMTINKAWSAVLMASNPPQISQPVAIRAAPQVVNPASGGAFGTVDFTNGDVPIVGCTGLSVENGVAICNTTFPQFGTFTINAGYSGDVNVKPGAGSLQLTVTKVAAGTFLAATPDAPVIGTPVTLNVLLAGASGVTEPTGSVTFWDGAVSLGTAAVSAGHAFLVVPSFSAGTHPLTAVYSGDANYQMVVSAPLPIVVAKMATTLALASTPAQIGQPVTLKAAVTVSGGATPGGTVSFSNGSVPIAGCTGVLTQNGVALCTAGFSQLGTYTINATYNGDASTAPSTASMALTVGKVVAGIYAASTPAAPVFGATVSVSVLLLGADPNPMPTGTVTFSEGAVTLASVPVDSTGRAPLSLPSASLAPLAVGSHTIAAVYNGDANYQTGTAAPLTIVVAKAATTLALSSNPPQIGQPVNMKASVTVVSPGIATPAGTLSFTNGGAPIAACTAMPLQSGSATCTFTLSQLGDYTIGASYGGDADTAPGTATRTLTVTKAAAGFYTASAPSAPVYGVPVTVNALLTPAAGVAIPTGTVTISEGSSLRVTIPIDSAGRAPVVLPSGPLAPLSAGPHTLAAAYSGDANYAAGTAAALNVTVGKAGTSTALTASFGAPFTATVAVLAPGAGTPTGTVQFYQNGTPIGSAPLVQAGSAFTATLPAGSQTGSVWAIYAGDANFGGSASTPFTVTPSTLVSISTDHNPAIAGQSVTFTVRVTAAAGTGTPGGSVQFSADGAALGTAALANGQASFTSTLAVGSHVISAAYSGDAVFPAATASFQQMVGKSTTSISLTSSAGTTVYGQPVTFTAQLALSGGSVQFSDSGVAIGSAPVSDGAATLVVASLATGAHAITAVWAGDANSAAAVSTPLTQTVNQAQTATALVASGTARSAAVTAVAPGAGSPTGTVKFVDAATNAVVATAALAGGIAATTAPTTSDPMVAVYSGDANFQASVSATLTPLTAVNAASYAAASFAPDEIVTLFGSSLATVTASITGAPAALLGGTTVTVTDSAGVKRAANLLFASPEQANILMPPDTAPGPATVTVTNADRGAVTTQITVTPTAPGLFTMNASGQGAPAGQIVRGHADGTQDAPQNVATFDPVQNQWIPAPIDWGPPTDVLYLVLYGTGLRHYSAAPTCTIAGQPVPVAYAGAQGGFAGLDQVNLALPRSLHGSGPVELKLVVDGTAANAVALVFQ